MNATKMQIVRTIMVHILVFVTVVGLEMGKHALVSKTFMENTVGQQLLTFFVLEPVTYLMTSRNFRAMFENGPFLPFLGLNRNVFSEKRSKLEIKKLVETGRNNKKYISR